MPIPLSSPLVVAPTPTPFTNDDRVDYDALSRNVERWLRTPLSGFVLGTANGEELALSVDEKARIVRTVTDAHRGQRFVIAGIDVPSTAETLRLAERYADAGADLIRVRFPRSMGSSQLEAYFREVTSRSPVPVVAIHQTFDDQPAAKPEVIGAVCQMDNVFGYITDHDLRFEGYVRPHVPADRRFWICNGGLLLYGTLLGANGACMWLGNVAPALCMDIVKNGYEGNFSEARPLQDRASRIDEVVGRYGVAGVKAALVILGYEGGAPRTPHAPLTQEQRDEVAAVLTETGILSL